MNTNTFTQLGFNLEAHEPPKIEEVQWLVEWLYFRPGFHTAKEIAKAAGTNDRKVRQLAEYSKGEIVSGPGSPGYCHTEHCAPDTIARIINALQSQAKNMLLRASMIERASKALPTNFNS
jgi:hypothetical protein